jgi:hypothetical protein
LADGIVTTLLENIKINLQDTTNYNAIAGVLKAVEIRGEFALLEKQATYAVIVPGDPEHLYDTVTFTCFWQPVTVYVVMRRLKNKTGDRTLLGTATVNGLDTMVKDARQALNRSSPYYNDKPSSSYTEQTGISEVRFDGVEYMGEEDAEGKRPANVAALTLAYLCADTR